MNFPDNYSLVHLQTNLFQLFYLCIMKRKQTTEHLVYMKLCVGEEMVKKCRPCSSGFRVGHGVVLEVHGHLLSLLKRRMSSFNHATKAQDHVLCVHSSPGLQDSRASLRRCDDYWWIPPFPGGPGLPMVWVLGPALHSVSAFEHHCFIFWLFWGQLMNCSSDFHSLLCARIFWQVLQGPPSGTHPRYYHQDHWAWELGPSLQMFQNSPGNSWGQPSWRTSV